MECHKALPFAELLDQDAEDGSFLIGHGNALKYFLVSWLVELILDLMLVACNVFCHFAHVLTLLFSQFLRVEFPPHRHYAIVGRLQVDVFQKGLLIVEDPPTVDHDVDLAVVDVHQVIQVVLKIVPLYK